jgi:hypothetical protein
MAIRSQSASAKVISGLIFLVFVQSGRALDPKKAITQYLQIFHKVAFLLLVQPQVEACVVMIYHVQQSREPSVVEETAFLVCPKSLQRRSAVAPVRRAVRLKIVDADLIGGMQIPTRLGVKLVRVATDAIRLSSKQHVASCRRFGVKAGRWRPGSRKR